MFLQILIFIYDSFKVPSTVLTKTVNKTAMPASIGTCLTSSESVSWESLRAEDLDDIVARYFPSSAEQTLQAVKSIEHVTTDTNAVSHRMDARTIKMEKELERLTKLTEAGLGSRKQLVDENDMYKRKVAFYEREIAKYSQGSNSVLRNISNQRIAANRGEQLSSKSIKSGEHIQRHSSKTKSDAKKTNIQRTQKSRGLFTGSS